MGQLDVSSETCHEFLEVAPVDGHDLVTVDRQENHGRIDDVRQADGTEQLARGSPETVVDGSDVDASERLRQSGLTRAASPNLTEHAGMSDRQFARQLCRLQTRPHRPLVALQCNECSAIEYQGHADVAFRRPASGARRRRTTTAFSRSSRC